MAVMRKNTAQNKCSLSFFHFHYKSKTKKCIQVQALSGKMSLFHIRTEHYCKSILKEVVFIYN
jgi:hypothetical protein